MDKGKEKSYRNIEEPIHGKRLVVFWMLFALTVYISTALYAFVASPLGDAYWVVGVDKYWIEEFGDMQGVKVYAEAMLVYDRRSLLNVTLMTLIPPSGPFFFLIPTVGLFVTIALAARRKERWKYAAIVYALLSVLSLGISSFSIPK